MPGLLPLALCCAVAIAAHAGQDTAPPVDWQKDLDYLLREFPQREKGLTAERRAVFEERMQSLKQRAAELDYPHTCVGVMQAVAAAGNAHTSARPAMGNGAFTRIPIRLHSFSDGIYVVKARPEWEHLLGAKVVGVNGHPIDAVMERIATIFSGNASWRRYNGTGFLEIPGILYGLDITQEPRACTMEFELRDGSRETNGMQAEEAGPPVRGQLWWNLSPAYKGLDGEWKHAIGNGASAQPLYLKDPHQPFWLEYLPEEKLLYVQYNASIEQGMPLRECREVLLDSFSEHEITRVVVDLRFNTGGDFTLMRGAWMRMLKEEPLQQPGSLYVITGPATFSAGLYCAANLKQEGKAIIVGELVGDDLDFWAEGDEITLPESGMKVMAQTGFHNYSVKDHPELEEHLFTKRNLETLEPDMPAPLSFTDYVALRDPSMEAILSREKQNRPRGNKRISGGQFGRLGTARVFNDSISAHAVAVCSFAGNGAPGLCWMSSPWPSRKTT